MKKMILLLLSILLLVAQDKLAFGQSFYHTKPVTVASFGGAVAIGNGEFFVGEATGFRDPGLVHVYRQGDDNTWETAQVLRASDAQVGDGFGRSLATSGQTLLVSNNHGTVFVFVQDGVQQPWKEVQQLSINDAAGSFGVTLAMDENRALVGAPQHGDGSGAVYVLHRQETTGQWTNTDKISDDNANRLGQTIVLHQDMAMVAAPGGETRRILIYRWNAEGSTWTLDSHIDGSTVNANPGFGLALQAYGNELLVGSPMDGEQSMGTVHHFQYDADTQTWTLSSSFTPSHQMASAQFGATIQATENGVWVGAPGSNNFAGELYRFEWDAQADTWAEATMQRSDDALPQRSRLGSSLAATADLVVAGATGSAYGEGSVVVMERSNGWEISELLFHERNAMHPILGEQVDCIEGQAASFACRDVDLVSFVPLTDLGVARGVRLSDVWGWTDPQTGNDYALVGHLEATVFVNLTDPSHPVYLGELPRTEGSPGSTWRDIKVYKDHAYIVADGAGEHGMQVFDLTLLRNVTNPPVTFEATAHYDGIHSAHNIVINEETGYAFSVGSSGGGETCGGGLHMIDIREPAVPKFAGCFADPTTGRRKTGYSHDAQCVIYHGPDAEHQGKEICLGSNETAISISDVTDKANPIPIGSGSYPDFGYVHQGWLSDDHRYFFQNDELDELSQKVDRTRTLVWDVHDLDDPIMVKEFFGLTSATDHNLYVRDNLMYQTNNASGLRIVDVTNPEEPTEVGFFDTTPYGTDESGFNGTWSSYPYFKDGMVVVTSRREGLFVLKKRSVDI